MIQYLNCIYQYLIRLALIRLFYIYNMTNMKINIKNLKGEVFSVQIESTQTIADLKELVKIKKGWPIDSQKIIFKGKTANNQDQIEKLGLKQSDFLVVMTQVQKPQPKPKVEEKPEQKNQIKVEKKQQKAQQKPPAVNNQPSQQQAKITELMCMGFPRQKCVQALRAAFSNTQRAVQYLINGIPASLQDQGESGSHGLSALSGLASLPQFDHIRQIIQTNPSALPIMLQQLSQTSPQLYSLIAEHPEQFERLIMQGGGDMQEEGDEQDDAGEDSENAPPGTILISAAEEQAINRLANLGFSKMQAAQAYMACDKNEELAANLLFDRLANGDIEGQFPGQEPDIQGGDEDDNLFN